MKNIETQPIDERRALVLDVKGYIHSLHCHPERRVPRSFVYKYVGADDSTYCIWESEKNDTMPPLWKLLRIAARTRTQAQLFEILGRHAGMEEADSQEGPGEDLRMLSDFAGAAGTLTSGIAKDLGDEDSPGVISPSEALKRLPAAVAAHEASERALNHLIALAAKEARHD